MTKKPSQGSINQQIFPLIPERILSELPEPPLLSVGTKSSTLTVAYNASGSPQRVPLTGTGIASQFVQLNVNALNFPNQLVGIPFPSQAISISSTGAASVNISAISIAGGQADNFSESNNCSSVAPGQSCTISVTFKPVSTGSKAATITIIDGAAGSPQRLALTGIGVSVLPLGLKSILPSAVVSGGASFLLTALGQGFAPNSAVIVNGTPLPTTYVSQGQLQAQIPAIDIAAFGSATITVQNSTGGTQTSGALTLRINAAAPDAVAVHGNTEHTGAVTFNTFALPSQSTWSVDVGGPPSYALIAEGKVVVTVRVGSGTQLVALNQQTGSVVWGPEQIVGVANAAYDGGKILIVSYDGGDDTGLMQSVDLATGVTDWTTVLTDQFGTPSGPTALNGTAFFEGAGTLYAVTEATGSIAWTEAVHNGGDSIPAVTPSGAYVSSECWTYAFQPSTGVSLFTNTTGCDGGSGGTPIVANDVLYSPNGLAYVGETFNASTGALLGSFVSDVLPAIGTDMGFFLQSGILSGITLSDDTVTWNFSGDGSLVTSPLLVNQTVFVGSSTGNLYGLNAVTGQQIWTVNAGGAIAAGVYPGDEMQVSALAAGDGLLVVPVGNRVVAYTLSPQ